MHNFSAHIRRRADPKRKGKRVRQAHRPAIIDEAMEEKLRKLAYDRTIQQNSFTRKTFAEATYAVQQADAKAKGANPSAVKRLKRTAMFRLEKRIVPITVKNPTVQNDRRHEVSRSHYSGSADHVSGRSRSKKCIVDGSSDGSSHARQSM